MRNKFFVIQTNCYGGKEPDNELQKWLDAKVPLHKLVHLFARYHVHHHPTWNVDSIIACLLFTIILFCFVVFSFSVMLTDSFLDELKGVNSPWPSHHYVIQRFLHPERTMALSTSAAIDVDEEFEHVLDSSTSSSEQQQQHQQFTMFSSNNSSQQPPSSPFSLSSAAATVTINRSTTSSINSKSSLSKESFIGRK